MGIFRKRLLPVIAKLEADYEKLPANDPSRDIRIDQIAALNKAITEFDDDSEDECDD